MVTSATIRRSEPQQQEASAIHWPCAADILDADGVPLSGVELLGPIQNRRLLLQDVEKPCALLAYCFGRGERQILVSFEDGVVEGWLATRWEGDRRSWWLELGE